MALSTQELSTLRGKLPHGSMKGIAETLNISYWYVHQTLTGQLNRVKSIEIIEEALRIVKELEARESKVRESIEKL